MPASFLLDPAMCLGVGGRYIPPWGSLNDLERDETKSLLKRLAGPGRQTAVIDELMQFNAAGYNDTDFARRAQVGFCW